MSSNHLGWNYVELADGVRRKMTEEEMQNHSRLPTGSTPYGLKALLGVGHDPDAVFSIELYGRTYLPPNGKSWGTDKQGMERLLSMKQLEPYAGEVRYMIKHVEKFC